MHSTMENTADDVWYEIFLHLLAKEIFKLKCISKVWLSTLSNPNFINKWYKLNYLSLPWALVGATNSVVCSHSKITGQEIYSVCNPLTQRWVSLPPAPRLRRGFVAAGFVCDDQCFASSLVSMSFKVIRIPSFLNVTAKKFKVQVFCSDLGEWNIYRVSCPQDVTWEFSDNLITHNGVFYWFQKNNVRKILAVAVNGNTNHGDCVHECKLINLPDRAMDGDIDLHHRLGVSEGLICYAMVEEREKSLSVWVLKENWCLLYKDNEFSNMLAEIETLLTGTEDFITQVRILGFNPVDKNVVILCYDKYIWTYNAKTKECEQLSHPVFQHTGDFVDDWGNLRFILQPIPSIFPPIPLRNTSQLDDQT